MEEARRQHVAGPGDDLIVTNGCQQALDLIGRVMLRPGDTVAVEDPVYPGLKNLLAGIGAQLVGIPVGADGIDIAQLERVLEREQPRFLVVTSNFQNPTGATLPWRGDANCWKRRARRGYRWWKTTPMANCATKASRCRPSSNWMSTAHRLTPQLFQGEFPGPAGRLGGGPKPLIDRLRQAKEAADLHTDQLSQAVLLEFAESGRLEAHRARVLQAGAERLAATLDACRRFLPANARWTRPKAE